MELTINVGLLFGGTSRHRSNIISSGSANFNNFLFTINLFRGRQHLENSNSNWFFSIVIKHKFFTDGIPACSFKLQKDKPRNFKNSSLDK